jgi:hypothetical protein
VFGQATQRFGIPSKGPLNDMGRPQVKPFEGMMEQKGEYVIRMWKQWLGRPDFSKNVLIKNMGKLIVLVEA